MHQNNHSLSWISHETLVKVTKRSFSGALKKLNEPDPNLRTDPTLLLAMNAFLNLPPEKLDRIQKDVSIVKSLQNAIGNFHQSILGSVEGWRSTGSTGGVIDLLSENAVPQAGNRHVVAEVKMRYNTIKASNECDTWDKLKDAAASRGGANECVAYIIQIIPKIAEPFDEPWRVSNRQAIPHVRRIDGRTAYHLITGDPNALDDLLHALPSVFQEALADSTHLEHADIVTELPSIYINEAISRALPAKSAFED